MQYDAIKFEEEKSFLKKIINIFKKIDISRDELTGVYDRKNFFKCLKHKKNGTLIEVKVMGINFINLNYGFERGDCIIRHIAKRLVNINKNSVVGRLSGTKFGIYTNEKDIELIKKTIEEIIKITKDTNICTEKVKISLNIAAIIYINDEFDIKDSINKIAMCMSSAIKKGENKYQIYNEKYEEYINIEMIEKAIENGEIVLHYQPKVHIKSNEIQCVEALIRWFNKEKLYIPSQKLIEFAEESGYINTLGKWVISRACSEIKKLNDVTKLAIGLSVNISPLQLEDENFLKDVKEIIEQLEFEKKLLKFEITENENIDHIETIQTIFNSIKNIGIEVSVDDFGSGYNSIDYIKNYNVDEIKIDRSLVIYVNDNPKFIESLINMIHTTNTLVVAEGVEKQQEYEALKEMGCDLIQGYYFFKPMSLEKLIEVVKINNQN